MRNELDSIIRDQLEWLFSGHATSKRFHQQLLAVAGYVAEETIPDAIAKQLMSLSRQVVLLDMLDSMLTPLNLIARANPSESTASQIVTLVAQIEETRRGIQACDPVNTAEVLGWILKRAREMKLIAREKR
jgi:hypothetical protein